MGAADSEAIRALEETANNIRQLQRETIAKLAHAREELAAQEKRAVKSGRWATKQIQAARAPVTDLESTLRVADEAIHETLIEIREARGHHWDAELVRLRGEYRTALQGTQAKALAFLSALEELQRLEGEAQRTLGGDEFPQLGRSMLVHRLRLWLENAEGRAVSVDHST